MSNHTNSLADCFDTLLPYKNNKHIIEDVPETIRSPNNAWRPCHFNWVVANLILVIADVGVEPTIPRQISGVIYISVSLICYITGYSGVAK